MPYLFGPQVVIIQRHAGKAREHPGAHAHFQGVDYRAIPLVALIPEIQPVQFVFRLHVQLIQRRAGHAVVDIVGNVIILATLAVAFHQIEMTISRHRDIGNDGSLGWVERGRRLRACIGEHHQQLVRLIQLPGVASHGEFTSFKPHHAMLIQLIELVSHRHKAPLFNPHDGECIQRLAFNNGKILPGEFNHAAAIQRIKSALPMNGQCRNKKAKRQKQA